MRSIKFYSVNDMSSGYYLIELEKLISEYESGKYPQDINEMIELYNGKKYFDNKVHLMSWTPDNIRHHEDVINEKFQIVAKFFSHITEDSFISSYNFVDIDYKDDFWELIDKFKVYERISKTKFQEFMNTSDFYLYHILKYKKITEYFGIVIKEYMINNSCSAELLLDKFEIKHATETLPLYLPKELSNTDKETIISNYIDSAESNLNYLQLISNIQSNKDKIEISPKTLLKAKKKVELEENQILKEKSGMLMETIVVFSREQEKESVLDMKGPSITATYSKKWIENNTDYETLLNNFIYLFNFVDHQMRCTFVNKFNNMGVFERFMITSSNDAYTKGIGFDGSNALSYLQMEGYYNTLFSIGIRLEEIIEWFFKEYLLNEFGTKDFRITMPSISSTLLEKCTSIMPAMESILKQFSMFAQEGYIDYELLEIRSEHVIYKNIMSLVDKKYVYGIGEEFKTATFLIFSDQSILGYNPKTSKSYKNFFELLCNEKLKLDNYHSYYISQVNWLIDHRYLSIDENGYVDFNNMHLIMILKDLFYNEVISYWKYPEYRRKIIDDLEKKSIVEFESSLFSRPEQDYINYFLNKSQFNNGLDLRNKYSHTQLGSCNDEKIHKQNYMIFLRIFILIIIKINDDFCTLDEIIKEK
jgi:hypothetical protein